MTSPCRSQWPHVLRSLSYWDCGFKSPRRHRCLSLMSFVCCQVEVSCVGLITGPEESYRCGVSKCDHEVWKGGLDLPRAVVQCKIKINNLPLMPYGVRRDKSPLYFMFLYERSSSRHDWSVPLSSFGWAIGTLRVTATRYGLDGSGIEFRRGEIFPVRSDRPRDPPCLLYNAYGVFPGIKAADS